MTIENIDALPENVFCRRDNPPTHSVANSQGKVLWFCPSIGWTEGSWQYPAFKESTHWSHAPERPPVQEDPKVQRDTAFKAWLQSFDAEFGDPALALLRLGWNAAWDRR